MPILKIADKKETLSPGSFWLLNKNINGYKNSSTNELATEAIAGRKFEVLKNSTQNTFSLKDKRIKVRLVEDGYICWLELKDIVNKIERTNHWEPILLSKKQIKEKLPNILTWIKTISNSPNQYLWGGTAGPNYDCSGLIQTAFSRENIWIPRDAYQQEIFCKKIHFNINELNMIIPGDLLFFGTERKCTHVAIYKGDGSYWHSSGVKNGRNGIGVDYLKDPQINSISAYYFSILRGAGRVESCHDGSFIA